MFAKSDTKSKEVLDLMHSDVCGPMAVKYFGGHKYYVTLINDLSSKTWLYLLNNKYEVFKRFQKFKNEVENTTERKIKTLRTNNGGEHTTKELIMFCKEERGRALFCIILKGTVWLKERIKQLKNVLDLLSFFLAPVEQVLRDT